MRLRKYGYGSQDKVLLTTCAPGQVRAGPQPEIITQHLNLVIKNGSCLPGVVVVVVIGVGVLVVVVIGGGEVVVVKSPDLYADCKM